jgi:tetratricopeptide (TPR) repeat protein
MRGLDEAERAFARAAELQPAVAAYRAHLLDLAFEWHADRASIARELEVYARLAPEAARTRAGRVAFALAFGDRTQKARAQVALDSLDSATATAVYSFLRHPRFAAEREAVFLAIDARPDDQARTAVLWLRFHDLALTEGRVREAVALLDDPAMPDLVRHCGPIILSVRGFKVPEEILETLAVSRADGSSLGDSAWVACAATYAADRGRWSDHAALLSHSRAMLARERAAGDTSSEREWDRVVRETEAHGLWRQGRKDEALRRFESVLSSHVDAFWVMWYVGQLSLDLGNLEKAERAFQQIATQFGLSPEPLAHLYLGRIYERTGRPAEALEAYDFFASAWREADPELQPLVQEARQAVTRLTGAKQ